MTLHGLVTGYGTGRRRSVVGGPYDAVLRAGRVTALIGPNGAGKSTLLRTLCALQPALGGEVLLGDGRPLRTLATAEAARRLAVVLTDRPDPGRLTAREVVALGRTPHLRGVRRASPADHAAVERALAATGAEALAERPYGDLSDGQRQRVLTARALAQEPELLVLDEPTAHLDAPSKVELLDVLCRIAREQDLAVLMSVHDLELAMQVADEVWLLDGDGVLHTGSPGDLASSGAIGRAFDRGRLRFDPDTWAFRVTREQVSAPLPALAGRGRPC